VGVEGLDLQDGEDLIVADSPLQFAEAVVSLIENDSGHARRRQLERAARAAVLRYDWSEIGRRFCQLMETLGSR
jgi:polysaccharide biosynthesis protein PslH